MQSITSGNMRIWINSLFAVFFYFFVFKFLKTDIHPIFILFPSFFILEFMSPSDIHGERPSYNILSQTLMAIVVGLAWSGIASIIVDFASFLFVAVGKAFGIDVLPLT